MNANILGKHFKRLWHHTRKHQQILITHFTRTKCFLLKGHPTCFCLAFVLVLGFCYVYFLKMTYALKGKIMPCESNVLPRTVYQCFILCTQYKCFLFSWSQIWITHLSWTWGRNTAGMMSWLITRNQMPSSQELCAWKQAPRLEKWQDPHACMDRQQHLRD